MVDKKTLEAAAQQLATEELVCRGMGVILKNAQQALSQIPEKSVFEGKQIKLQRQLAEETCQASQANFDRAHTEVVRLTAQANSLRARSEELSAKRYWWDVPFRQEDPQEPDAYFFDGGTYVEVLPLKTGIENASSVMYHKKQPLNHSLLSMRLTDGRVIPLFLDKKKLRLHINDAMESREIYHVMSVSGHYSVISYMNNTEDPSMEIWRNFQAAAAARRAEYDEYLQEHEARWDARERIRHGSFYTNEERWMVGQMSSEDYLRESLWRDYPAQEKRSKMRDDIRLMEIKANRAQQEARKHFVKTHKGAVYETNLIRLMPVAETIYCGDELLAILLRTTPQSIMEYDCDPDVDPDELSGRYFNRRELFKKKPALIPLVRFIAAAYQDLLPDHKVLKPCPQDCPDYLWRIWSEIRWARQVTSQA